MDSQSISGLLPLDHVNVRGRSEDGIMTPHLQLAEGFLKMGLGREQVKDIMVAYFSGPGCAVASIPVETATPSEVLSVGTSDVSVASTRSSLRAAEFFSAADALPVQEGYCYLWLVRPRKRLKVKEMLGECPMMCDLVNRVPSDWFCEKRWGECRVTESQLGYHIAVGTREGATFRQMLGGFDRRIPGVLTGIWKQAAGLADPVDNSMCLISRLGVSGLGLRGLDLRSEEQLNNFSLEVDSRWRHRALVHEMGVSKLEALVVQRGSRDIPELVYRPEEPEFKFDCSGQERMLSFGGGRIVSVSPGVTVMLAPGCVVCPRQSEIWIFVVGTVMWHVWAEEPGGLRVWRPDMDPVIEKLFEPYLSLEVSTCGGKQFEGMAPLPYVVATPALVGGAFRSAVYSSVRDVHEEQPVLVEDPGGDEKYYELYLPLRVVEMGRLSWKYLCVPDAGVQLVKCPLDRFVELGFTELGAFTSSMYDVD